MVQAIGLIDMSMMKKIVVISVIVGGLYFGARAAMPRGIRNKNPMNIEYQKSNNWDGQTGTDGRFATFSSSIYGIRAGAKLISNYMTNYNLTSVIQILERFAPATENHTAGYAKFVAEKMGITPSERITKAQIPSMVKAMIQMENGIQPYSDDHIFKACKMAGVV